VFQRRRPFLEIRAAALDAVRAHFKGEGFAEVETPALQASPGLEPHLSAFATDMVSPDRAVRHRLYLHTSPEFAMKKLLVAGEPRIFQVCKTYRNAERAPTHHPEFTMIEWYRAGAGYETIMADCEGLLRAVARAAGRRHFVWNGVESDPSGPWRRASVVEAFRAHANIDLIGCMGVDPQRPDGAAFRAAARASGVRVTDADTWDDVFFRSFLEKIEPHLGHPTPTLLYDYPISMAALARPKPSDPRFAERVELYVSGLELANGFGELTDAAVQRARFERDMELKARLYGERYPIDDDFIAALSHGMPESAGIALGFDRLVMLASGASHIEDVLWAPVADSDRP
jgi:lysyl-tRNA synthetase class 2